MLVFKTLDITSFSSAHVQYLSASWIQHYYSPPHCHRHPNSGPHSHPTAHHSIGTIAVLSVSDSLCLYSPSSTTLPRQPPVPTRNPDAIAVKRTAGTLVSRAGGDRRVVGDHLPHRRTIPHHHQVVAAVLFSALDCCSFCTRSTKSMRRYRRKKPRRGKFLSLLMR